MTIVGWSPEDDKLNAITAVEPTEDNKDKINTSKGKTKEAVEPAEIEPIIEE
jgi:hypothetical protein